MNKSYLRRSQEVKNEILADEDMLDNIKLTFTHPNIEDMIAQSPAGEIYRIGTLRSGIYVALKIPVQYNAKEIRIIPLENYCKHAEKADSKGKDVVDFCIGAICGKSKDDDKNKIGLLFEDLTAGGKNIVESADPHRSMDYLLTKVITPKGKYRIVFTGLNHGQIPNSEEGKALLNNLKYFNEKRIIRIRKVHTDD